MPKPRHYRQTARLRSEGTGPNESVGSAACRAVWLLIVLVVALWLLEQPAYRWFTPSPDPAAALQGKR